MTRLGTALPDLVVDSHQHFWTGNRHFGAGDYLPGDYLADVAAPGTRIGATVFVECNTHYDASLPEGLRSTGETAFAARIGTEHVAAPIRLAAAIVGHADPLAEDIAFEAIVDAHIAAGAGRLRALRRSSAWDEDAAFNYPTLRTRAHMLADARFRRALAILADRDLAFETWIYHPQLDELAALARAVPDCAVILDHAGTALAAGAYADRDRTWRDWKEAMARLSDRSNVHVKLGGLITTGSWLDRLRQQRGIDRWDSGALAEAMAPWLDAIVASFGPERCLFESNFPVDAAHCTLPVLLDAYSDALGGLDDAARAAVFGGNAIRLYRLDLAGQPTR